MTAEIETLRRIAPGFAWREHASGFVADADGLHLAVDRIVGGWLARVETSGADAVRSGVQVTLLHERYHSLQAGAVAVAAAHHQRHAVIRQTLWAAYSAACLTVTPATQDDAQDGVSQVPA